MRKTVWNLTQVSIIIFKTSYFSFTFKLNEKTKVLLKNMVGKGGGYKKMFAGGRGESMFKLGVGNVSNGRGDLTWGGEKISKRDLGPSKKL